MPSLLVVGPVDLPHAAVGDPLANREAIGKSVAQGRRILNGFRASALDGNLILRRASASTSSTRCAAPGGGAGAKAGSEETCAPATTSLTPASGAPVHDPSW